MAKLQGKVSRVLKYHVRRRGSTIFLGLLFVLGVLAGTRLYTFCDEETVKLLTALFGLQQDSTRMELFHNRFFTEAAQLFLLFFCGFCAIGQPIALFLLFYRGLGLGIMSTFLAQQGRETFSYYALIILPQTLLFLMLQITASKEAVSFSLNFLRQLLGSSGRGLSITTRVYVLRFVLLLALSLAASFLGAILTQALRNHLIP